MCCRYYVAPEALTTEEYKNLTELERRYGCDVRYGDVAPGDYAPVYAADKSGGLTAYPMRWGFANEGKSNLVFNARSETADVKPMFAPSFAHRRCAVPANGYYEWKKTDDGKEKYAMTSKDGKVIYLAALYRYEKGKTLPAFTVLTGEASPGVADIHDRMPVVLTQSDAKKWIDGGELSPVRELDVRADGD